MNGSQLATLLGIVAFFGGGWILENTTLIWLKLAVGLILGGMFYLLVVGFNPLKRLWVGPTYEAMGEHLEAVRTELDSLEISDATKVQRSKLRKKEDSIQRQMDRYRHANG